MVHTLPDYTTKYKMTTIFGNIDTGELAARLGSIDTFDRRGNVIWYDDFEAPVLHWGAGTQGTNAAVTLTTAWAKTGSRCCRITAGEGAGGQAWIYRFLGAALLGKIGGEISFTVNPDTYTIQIELRYYDGVHFHTGTVKYSHATGLWQVNDDTLGWVSVLSDYKVVDTNNTFHTVKQVIDTDTNKFVRLLINDQVLDISSYTIKESNSATKPCLYTGLIHRSDNAAAKSIYVDNVILTQNEP